MNILTGISSHTIHQTGLTTHTHTLTGNKLNQNIQNSWGFITTGKMQLRDRWDGVCKLCVLYECVQWRHTSEGRERMRQCSRGNDRNLQAMVELPDWHTHRWGIRDQWSFLFQGYRTKKKKKSIVILMLTIVQRWESEQKASEASERRQRN